MRRIFQPILFRHRRGRVPDDADARQRFSDNTGPAAYGLLLKKPAPEISRNTFVQQCRRLHGDDARK